jgi:hypothetical protein
MMLYADDTLRTAQDIKKIVRMLANSDNIRIFAPGNS